MNTTQPPDGSPLHDWIHAQHKGNCFMCRHLWEVEGLYGCGISGKFILEMFIKDATCDKYERDDSNERQE